MPMQEVINLSLKWNMVRIPLAWIRDNYGPADKIQILRELDGNKIIITAIAEGEQTNAKPIKGNKR